MGTLRKPPGRLAGNLALALLSPVVFFGVLEAVFALAGVKPIALTDDPFVGFSSGQPLYVERTLPDGTRRMVTNPVKEPHFNIQSFARKKPPGTFRIFTLGGSTAYGHPWKDPVSFGGWLREILPAADKTRNWEVINAGGISYASYREARLVDELSGYEPDLFIVYSGHNEFLEERTYRETADVPGWIRETGARLDRTRVYSVLRRAYQGLIAQGGSPAAEKSRTRLSGEVNDVLSRSIGPTAYVRDDVLRSHVLDHYQASLRRMAALAKSAGAQVLFLTTPGNERDCSPFKSEPTPGLSTTTLERSRTYTRLADTLAAMGTRAALAASLRTYDSALALDSRNPSLLYKAGQAALTAGRHDQAKKLLVKSLDEDICPLRALPAMHALVRGAAEAAGMPWLDVSALLEEKTRKARGHAVLGEPEFVDHVHLSIEDYRLLALAILRKMEEAGWAKPAPEWEKNGLEPVIATVMAKVDDKEQGISLHNLAKVTNWAGKHEDAARISEKGLRLDSTSLEAIWSSLFVGAARERQGRGEEAIVHYRRAVRLDPANPQSLRLLGGALHRNGHDSEAVALLSRADAAGPDDPETRLLLGMALLKAGKASEALPHLFFMVGANPGRPDLQVLLGDALMLADRAEDALGYYRRALELNPREARAYLGLARIAQSRGNVGESINNYARALSLDPGLVEARQALSRSLGGMQLPGR